MKLRLFSWPLIRLMLTKPEGCYDRAIEPLSDDVIACRVRPLRQGLSSGERVPRWSKGNPALRSSGTVVGVSEHFGGG